MNLTVGINKERAEFSFTELLMANYFESSTNITPSLYQYATTGKHIYEEAEKLLGLDAEGADVLFDKEWGYIYKDDKFHILSVFEVAEALRSIGRGDTTIFDYHKDY